MKDSETATLDRDMLATLISSCSGDREGSIRDGWILRKPPASAHHYIKASHIQCSLFHLYSNLQVFCLQFSKQIHHTFKIGYTSNEDFSCLSTRL